MNGLWETLRSSASSARRVASSAAVYARMGFLLLARRPYKLTLLVSGGCNLRCQVCSIFEAPNTTLTLRDVERIWSAFPIKPCWINVSGGEPTLNRDLEAILSFFVEMDRALLITLTTNGYADATPLVERVLLRNRRSLIYTSVSLDGNEHEHDTARGRPRSFARAMRTYRGLRSLTAKHAPLAVGISTTISRVNHRHVLPFIRDMLGQGAAVSVNLAQASTYYMNTRADSFRELPARDLVRLLRAVQYLLPKTSLDSLLKVTFLEGAIRHLEQRYAPVPCASYVSNLLVTSELDLVDCTVRFQPWAPKDSPREAKLQAIVDAIRYPEPRRRRLREQIRASGCEQTCHTPCESYVHTISALLDPRHAPRILLRYLRICLESSLVGRRGVERALAHGLASGPRADAGVSPTPRRVALRLVRDPQAAPSRG